MGQDFSQIYTGVQKNETLKKEFQQILERSMNQEQDNKELKEACESFESYYVQQLFKEMRKTVPESGLFEKNNARELYTEMLDGEYAKIISEGQGIGVGKALYKQLASTNK